MKRFVLGALAIAFVGLVGITRAEEKANPTGTWKWTINAGGQSREATLKLKLDGDKLTGTIVGRDGKDVAIEDAKYKDGQVSFTVTRERNGNKIPFKYTGKVSGDTLKGKIEFERDAQVQSRDWDAKRVKD
jgi:hypothetical protein